MEQFSSPPQGVAYVSGAPSLPALAGTVTFYQKPEGVLVTARVSGLPRSTGFFAFHLHQGSNCSGQGFPNTGGHYNPTNSPHPEHPGDFPPLLSCGGSAYLSFLTDRFAVEDVVGRVVVIHSDPDDFHSQPAGNSGTKIACGVIKAL